VPTMGCCASNLEAIQEAAEKRIEAVKENLLQQKAQNLELDKSILDTKQGVRELQDGLEAVMKRYKLYSDNVKEVLQLPSLAVWARDTNFVGSAKAATQIQHLAGHQFELSALEKSVRHIEVKACAQKLEEAEEKLGAAVKICNAYIQSEVKFDEKKKKFEDASAADEKAAEALAQAETAATAAKTELDAAEDGKEALDTTYSKAVLVAEEKKNKQDGTSAAKATAEAAFDAAKSELELAKTAALEAAPLSRTEAEGLIQDAFVSLQTGYERFHVGAEDFAANPEKRAPDFASYAPKASAGLLDEAAGILGSLFASKPKEGEEAAEAEAPVPAEPTETADKVMALKAGCTSAVQRSAAASKAIKTWSKLGLSSMLGPKTLAKTTEESLLAELGKLVVSEKLKQLLETLTLADKEAREAAFAEGACEDFQAAAAAFKDEVEKVSRECSEWAGALKNADAQRAKNDKKDKEAEADAASDKPEASRRQPCDESEKTILKILDEKVATDFEALMAKAEVLKGDAEGSVEVLLLKPLQAFMDAQTAFLMARKVAGVYEAAAGGVTHESLSAEAEVQDEGEGEADAVAAEEAEAAAAEAEEEIVYLVQAKAVKRAASRASLGGQPGLATEYLTEDLEAEEAVEEAAPAPAVPTLKTADAPAAVEAGATAETDAGANPLAIFSDRVAKSMGNLFAAAPAAAPAAATIEEEPTAETSAPAEESAPAPAPAEDGVTQNV